MVPKIVNDRLRSSQELKSYVDDRIWPIVSDEEQIFPYIAFSRTMLTPIYTKDLYTEDSVGIEIVAACRDYFVSLEIIEIVRELFDCRQFKDDNIFVSQIRTTAITEEYNEANDVFVQRISFDFRVR